MFMPDWGDWTWGCDGAIRSKRPTTILRFFRPRIKTLLVARERQPAEIEWPESSYHLLYPYQVDRAQDEEHSIGGKNGKINQARNFSITSRYELTRGTPLERSILFQLQHTP